MKTFKIYLEKKYHYSEITIQEKINQILQWKRLCLSAQELSVLNRKELLPLIELLSIRYSSSTLNNYLKTLEQYYNYLVETQTRKENPVKGFRIKLDQKTLLRGLFTEQELTNIYNTYSTKGHLGGRFHYYRQRNKVILGLLIYQALDSATLDQLEIKDIDLEKEIIKIPSSSTYKLNDRILKIQSNQILEIKNYLTHTREELLKILKIHTHTKKLFPKSDKTKFSSITQSIKNQIGVEKLIILRYSRIAIWKKRYNLRQTQYKAGYKSILSLEKFNQQEIEILKQAIDKYHPL
ncbi:site-specific integrase [Apibacter muscae]|uniref:Site-specific integrase n=1 Tax=Apibacter muscae TaxID=2509004 RepID=A0A563DNH1_9FLAO|nr:site-specific integrase [Apibacter muscae]TWP31324.1 site-specific integrase [Apibacter muscae]